MRLFQKFGLNLCKSRLFVLAFLWTISIASGALLCTISLPPFSLMRLICTSQVTIVGLIVSVFLPFSFAIIFAHYHNAFISVLILIFRGLLYSYCLFSIAAYFGSATWLVCTLLLFSAGISNVAIAWYIFRSSQGKCHYLLFDRLTTSVMIISTAIIDCFLVSPFLASLMNRV